VALGSAVSVTVAAGASGDGCDGSAVAATAVDDTSMANDSVSATTENGRDRARGVSRMGVRLPAARGGSSDMSWSCRLHGEM
jgi:hypothetical protein